MTPVKGLKGWAVVAKNGRIVEVSLKRSWAIDLACDHHWRGWSDNLWRDMKAAGYRCIPVTIQEARQDD